VLERAGVADEQIRDAQLVVMELAANAEKHALPPYELRIYGLCGVPAWCEVVDGDPDLGEIPALLDRPIGGDEEDLPASEPLEEGGRGLLLVRYLSYGCCYAYATRTLITNRPGKAVGFALPTRTGTHPTFPAFLTVVDPSLTRLRGTPDEECHGRGR
jgi:hypothetical protein